MITRRRPAAFAHAAVVLGDDDMMSHVYQFARQVAGVGKGELVGPGLVRTVRGDPVFMNAQSLAQVAENWVLDDRAPLAGPSHQPAQTGQLVNLLPLAPRP